jgi:hypothetical protein
VMSTRKPSQIGSSQNQSAKNAAPTANEATTVGQRRAGCPSWPPVCGRVMKYKTRSIHGMIPRFFDPQTAAPRSTTG